jgi:hypothetical protein
MCRPSGNILFPEKHMEWNGMPLPYPEGKQSFQNCEGKVIMNKFNSASDGLKLLVFWTVCSIMKDSTHFRN